MQRAGLHLITIALKVVVEGELHAGRDVLGRKEADGQLTTHHPLLRLTVGPAGVVDEAPKSPLHTKPCIGCSQHA